MDEESEFSLHFQLGEVKSSLVEVKEKLDEIRMGEVRCRGSRGSSEFLSRKRVNSTCDQRQIGNLKHEEDLV